MIIIDDIQLLFTSPRAAVVNLYGFLSIIGKFFWSNIIVNQNYFKS